MGVAIRSMKMWEPEAKREVVLEVSHEEMDALERAVRKDSAVMSALREYLKLSEASLTRGAISSPEPPASMGLFWQLLRTHNPMWPGTMGSQIRQELENRIFKEQGK
ncbi:hypothetical protein [Phaeobacter inhibens]|uniref:hypothetical protein n=1 Tax=Phaeobacter inhibens TaxID=221822 RepID=UPI0021A27FA8|nr:hypothetical protein [Phaeobacter inhibens]UWR59942.1 hypothetical protein K4F88_13610 [Phaeobacter inhibens]